MSDDECEEWVGWLDIAPKRVIRMTSRVRHAERVSLAEPTTGAKTMLRRDLSTPENREFWRAVRAASEAVAEWPEWKRLGVEGDE